MSSEATPPPESPEPAVDAATASGSAPAPARARRRGGGKAGAPPRATGANRASTEPRPAADKPIEHRYIAIEGPIGVGKTSLARKLADGLSAELVLEQAAENPFLERFYRHPRVGAFPAQLYFLFQRAQQLGSLNQADLFARLRIADYLLEKDRLFAQVTLDEAEYGLYDQVYAKLGIVSPKPDLVVYLQAPVGVLLERIARRGIDYEQRIDAQYLERLNEAYAKFFHDYEAAPLLIVNAASIDPIGNESDYDELLSAIKRMGRGKLYFNPLRSGAI